MDLQRLEHDARRLQLPFARVRWPGDAGRSLPRSNGLRFASLREYVSGDDVRRIDWKATARFARPFVKTFEEEWISDLLVVLDVSASLGTSEAAGSKAAIARELAALFTLVARNHDHRVALVLCSDRIEVRRGLGRGSAHAGDILRTLSQAVPVSRGTSFAIAAAEIDSVLRRPGCVLFISDFVGDDYVEPFRRISRRHEMLALAVADARDADPPDVGLVRVTDAETGRVAWLDTASVTARARVRANWIAAQAARRNAFHRARVSVLDIPADRPYFGVLRAACAARPPA